MDEKLIFWGLTEKSNFCRGGSRKTNIEGGFPKNAGLGQVGLIRKNNAHYVKEQKALFFDKAIIRNSKRRKNNLNIT